MKNMENKNGENKMKKIDANRLSDAIGEIDESLIAEYETKKDFRAYRIRMRTRIIAAAASVAIVVAAVPRTLHFMRPHDAADIPPQETTAPDNANNKPSDDIPDDSLFSIVSVTASSSSSSFIDGDTSFVVKTENGSKELVERHLMLEPAIDYTVQQTGSDEFTVTPKKSLGDNTVVSLSYVKNKEVDYSWAFQTKSELSVTETYPASGAMTVSENAVIEIELSCPDAENLPEETVITPALEGEWLHLGRVWRFTPSAPMEPDTTYTVSLSDRISADGTEMKNPYSFTFSTYKNEMNGSIYPELLSADGINTYRPDDAIKIRYSVTENFSGEVTSVKLKRFADADDFEKYISGASDVRAEDLGEVAFTESDDVAARVRTITLDKNPGTGYYAASVYCGRFAVFEWTVQINPISVYAAMTGEDIFVWAIEDGKTPTDKMTVEFGSAEYTTDGDGILTISGAKADSGDFLVVGGDTPVFVGAQVYNTATYPNTYIYLDRNLYKPTDKVNVWGYVPMSRFPDGADGVFTLRIIGNSRTAEQSLRVTPDENGAFTASFELNSHLEGSIYVELLYDGVVLNSHSLEIENYENEYYKYEIASERDYAAEGEAFEFDVTVTHITGMKAVGKKVCLSFSGTGEDEITAVTDENGTAHFSAVPDLGNFFEGIAYVSVYLRSAESGKYPQSPAKTVHVLRRDCRGNWSGDDGEYVLDIERLDMDSFRKSVSAADLKYVPYDTNVTLTVTETRTEKYLAGYEYNEYTKENEPTYGYVTSSQTVYSESFDTEDGKLEFSADSVELRESEGNVTYSYQLYATFSDTEGRPIKVTDYGFGIKRQNEKIFYTGILSEGEWYISGNFAYGLYGYEFVIKNGTDLSSYMQSGLASYGLSYGETAKIDLLADGRKKVEGGTVVRIVSANGILSADKLDAGDDLSFEFADDCFPNSTVSGVYLKDGVFNRIKPVFISAKPESRTLNVSVESDKKSYAPGDEVTLRIKTAESDGSGRRAAVIVSVVNEAVFANVWDRSDIISEIYAPVYYPVYTFSSDRDFNLTGTMCGGRGGGPEEVRGNFGGTAYFGQVTTDENGEAEVTFTLPDNVTEYRITLQAADAEMYVGKTESSVDASLDFFISSEPPKKVKTADDFAVSASAVCERNLDAEFEFTLDGEKTRRVSAKTNTPVSVNFGKLDAGEHTVRIKVSAGELTDAIIYTADVIRTAQGIAERSFCTLTDGAGVIETLSDPAMLEISSENTVRAKHLVEFLKNNVSPRFDTMIGARYGAQLCKSGFGDDCAVPQIKLYKYTDSFMLKQLENSEPDEVLTALSLYFTPETVSQVSLSPRPISEVSDIDSLLRSCLIGAAKRSAVLDDLLYLKTLLENDEDADAGDFALLSLSFAMLGEYKTASEMYDTAKDLPESDEWSAILALCASFVDRSGLYEKVSAMIDEDPAREYLPFAAIACLKALVSSDDDVYSVTVESGDFKKKIDVSGFETVMLPVPTGGDAEVKLSDATEGISVAYCCERKPDGDRENEKDYGISLSLPDRISQYGDAVLTVDLSASEIKSGELRIALPNSLKTVYSYISVEDGNVFADASINGKLTLYIGKDAPRVFTLPLVASEIGEYVLEEAVFVSDGMKTFSHKVLFEVE